MLNFKNKIFKITQDNVENIFSSDEFSDYLTQMSNENFISFKSSEEFFKQPTVNTIYCVAKRYTVVKCAVIETETHDLNFVYESLILKNDELHYHSITNKPHRLVNVEHPELIIFTSKTDAEAYGAFKHKQFISNHEFPEDWLDKELLRTKMLTEYRKEMTETINNVIKIFNERVDMLDSEVDEIIQSRIDSIKRREDTISEINSKLEGYHEVGQNILEYNGKKYKLVSDETEMYCCPKCALHKECLADDCDDYLTLCGCERDLEHCYYEAID